MNALAIERDVAHRTGRVPAPILAEPLLDALQREREADWFVPLPPALVVHAPELRDVGVHDLVRTPTGIVIGGAWCRPPEPQSADADRVQRALLEVSIDDEHTAATAATREGWHPDDLLVLRFAVPIGLVVLVALAVEWIGRAVSATG